MTQVQFEYLGSSYGRVCIEPVPGRSIPTISLTLPDGTVEAYQPEFTCKNATMSNGQLTAGIQFSYTLKPVSNNQGSFDLIGQHTVEFRDGKWLSDSGTDIDANGNTVYNWFVPSDFYWQSRDGIRYDLGLSSGLKAITTPAGDRLSIDSTGVRHTAAPVSGSSVVTTSLSLTRDTLGRITQIKLPDNRVWYYNYDTRGDLIQVTAPNNDQTRYVYDNQHRLSDITDALGQRLQGFDYDAQGRLIGLTDGNGQRTQLEHDLAANVERSTDRLGRVHEYHYDDYGNITQEIDPLGNITTRTYNNSYDQLSETDPLGRTTTWSYNDHHDKLTETNALGQITHYSYTPQGQLLSETDHTGRIVSQTSYQNGLPTEIKDSGAIAEQRSGTLMSYSGSNLASLTDALGNSTHYSYDSAGQLSTLTDALGKTISYSYDANQHKTREIHNHTRLDGSSVSLTNTWEYDAKGRNTREIINGVWHDTQWNDRDQKISDTMGWNTLATTTRYRYDANGKLIQTTHPDGSNSTNEYDLEGNLIAEIDPLGRRTSHHYDALNRKISTTTPDGATTRTEYDAVGNVLSETNALGQTTRYEYDALNRRIASINALGQRSETHYNDLGQIDSDTDPAGNVTRYRYNAAGQRIETLYPDGSSTQTDYDALGRKTSSIDELGQRTQYSYDTGSHLTQVTDALGQTTQYRINSGGQKEQHIDALGRITRYGYTVEGRLNLRTLPLGQRLTSDYDNKGRRGGSTDARGQYTTYSYDVNDRLVQTNTYTLGLDIRDYDPAGRLIKTEQRPANATQPGPITRYSYDAADRLTEELKANGDRLNYSYDLNGNLTQQSTTPTGQGTQTTQTQYDALNRPIQITDASGTTTIRYDAVGNKTQETKANGLTTRYGYDQRNRLTQIRHEHNGQVLAQYRYTLDAAGQRTQLEETDAQGQIKVTTWDYDAVGRLIKETQTPQGSPTRTTEYSFDAVGNITQKTVNGVITSYVYDVNDRLTSETSNGVTTTYTYDNQGNTLSENKPGSVKSFSYNAKNQLAAATINGQSMSFGYDMDGIRNSKTVAGVTTNYLTDKNTAYVRVVQESTAGNTTQYRYGLGNQLLSQSRNGSDSYYLQDALGSTKALTDATGTLTDSYAYDAYGDIIASSGSTSSAYQYAGEQYDSDLGVYYNRARYYDQSIGRFTQMDSYLGRESDPITLNKYLYANGNPVMYTDPSGNMSIGFVLSQNAFIADLRMAGTYASNAVRVYDKVTTILGFFDTYNAIKEAFSGAAFSQQTISSTRTGIGKSDINMSDAAASAMRYFPMGIMIGGTFPDKGGWYEGYLSSKKHGKKLTSFFLQMPMLYNGPGGSSLPDIPTGIKIKFGNDRVPLKIDFGHPMSDKYGGTLIGFGLTMGSKRELMRMDYHTFDPNHGGGGTKNNEIAVWQDDDFHYHVMKW